MNFFTKSVKQSLKRKIYRTQVWLVDIAELWVDQERQKKDFTTGCEACEKIKTGGGEGQKQKTPWVVKWNESEKRWLREAASKV